MKTLKQARISTLIVATLFCSTAVLAEGSEPTSELVQSYAEASKQIYALKDGVVSDLRQQLSQHIKEQVTKALSTSAELVKKLQH